MNGLELSERFYLDCVKPMLETEFSDLLGQLAIGLFGSGSECGGFDDEVSTDHDFEPGVCILLPDESIVDRQTAFRLERAYCKLPKEFLGYRRSGIAPVGGARHGVLRTADVFSEKVGASDGILTVAQWLTVPEHALFEATNGRIFFDGRGEVTRIREALSAYPEDVRKKEAGGQSASDGAGGTVQLPALFKARGNRRGAAGGRGICEKHPVSGVPAEQGVYAVL